MEFLTVAEYAKKRSVSRQFIYEYIKKGKFELVELPIFVEYKGKKYRQGTKKFLVIKEENT